MSIFVVYPFPHGFQTFVFEEIHPSETGIRLTIVVNVFYGFEQIIPTLRL